MVCNEANGSEKSQVTQSHGDNSSIDSIKRTIMSDKNSSLVQSPGENEKNAQFLDRNTNSFTSSLRQTQMNYLNHSQEREQHFLNSPGNRVTLQNQNKNSKRSKIDLKSLEYIGKQREGDISSPFTGDNSLVSPIRGMPTLNSPE